ncbi:hypothetical protein ACFP2F_22280 [Hymenobacter artigasi]|uniref:Uncharacterized protein n=1 Tax=Hymenobacter artigasi TaxID=2719616 RepID=A0ABX1HIJ0_9BACT|nr:hypothetical protein [Hymenobacter artigasi]NKI90020.1 hypothetical protein [Hymenobacter artigasi]
MGITDNKPVRPLPTASTVKMTKGARLAQAREYAKQFVFDTLSAEDLKKMRRNAYAYAI